MAEETNQLRVRLVTPERILFEHAASAVELPAKNGYMEVLYGHAPLVAELGAGDVIVHCAPESASDADKCGPTGESRFNVSWGFVEVLPGRVTILASDALKPEEIDLQRAQQQLDRGEKMWKEAGESEDAYTEALHVISEAEAKISSATEVTKAH
ncbi:MAG: ATP synthase F1 subunit epsilon [Terracidiphilus sp.]|jgi:F-type H+-transporting ATPase subunit epsilon